MPDANAARLWWLLANDVTGTAGRASALVDLPSSLLPMFDLERHFDHY